MREEKNKILCLTDRFLACINSFWFYRGVEKLVSRRAHNPKAAGSSPVPATIFPFISPFFNSIYIYIFFFLISLVLRFAYGYFSHYTEDEARMWQLGFFALENKSLINHGMPVVYSQSLLPGSFQSLLSAVPLLLWSSPLSLIFFIQILNAVSQLLLYGWITSLFPQGKNLFVYLFFIFSPWSILFSYAWNPSFLPIFSMIYIINLMNIIKKDQSLPAPFFSFRFSGAHFFLIAPLFLTIQLNLQVAVLIVSIAAFMIWRVLSIPSLFTLGVSFVPGLITFWPWLKAKYNLAPFDEPTWGFSHSVGHSIQLHLSHFVDGPHQILRLFSFVSGDTVNRFESGFLKYNFTLIPFLIFGEVLSIALILVSVTFLFSKTVWSNFFEIITFKAHPKDKGLYEKLDFICLMLILLLVFSSLFSLVTLGVHSLLCLNFLSYFVFFRQMSKYQFFSFFWKKRIFIPYLVITTSYSVIGGASFRSTYDMIHKIAPSVCRNLALPPLFSQLQPDLQSQFMYTSNLLCPYFTVEK